MKKIYGFSLVEVLISLITISLIMSAFAPVITKKVHTNTALGDGSKKSKPFPYNPLDPNCEAHENYIDCKFKTPDNISRVSAVIVSGGGGGAGGVNGEILPNQIKEVSNGRVEIPITKEMKNVLIANLIGGGGGGGGGAFYTTGDASAPSVAFCNKLGALYIPAAYNGSGGKDLCVMKKNLCYRVYNANYGTTEPGACSTPDGDSPHGFNLNQTFSYCGQYRPIGTKKGDWRPVKPSEMAGWANVINNETKSAPKIQKWLYEKGLNFCSGYANIGSKDIYGIRVCSGSNGEGYDLYAADEKISYNKYNRVTYTFNNGTFKKVGTGSGMTRCVYAGSADASGNVTSAPASYSSSGGGAGASGSRVSGVAIPDGVIASAEGGKIVLTAGAPGSAGAKGASNGASAGSGTSGGASGISVYNASGAVVYSVSVSGGTGGFGATKTTAGTGGSASNTCTGSISTCSTINPAGASGTLNLNKTTATVSQGGAQSGSGYGAGGAGGSSSGTSSNPGNAGGAGYAKITYDLRYQGAGGGGGGGASLIHIDNIPVTAGKEYTVRIGGGGKGGTINSDGSDGGESAIWFDNLSVSISGGTGGKTGTGATSRNNAIQGTGGNKGIITKTGTGGTTFLQKEGSSGGAGSLVSNGSSGGAGGLSGGQIQRACGGFQTIALTCSNGLPDGETLRLENFGNIFKDGNYGITGSGGGGGGWHNDNSLYPYPGTGGKGQQGYVYLYY